MHVAPSIDASNLDDITRLDSINESEVNSMAGTHAHLSAHLHEQALSARLTSMEQSGAFGVPMPKSSGINIGTGRMPIDVSPTSAYGSSLRVARISTVGSLEHARQIGGSKHALSPLGNHWDRTSSGSDASDSEASENDSGGSDRGRFEEGASDGSSRCTSRDSAAGSTPPSPKKEGAMAPSASTDEGRVGADGGGAAQRAHSASSTEADISTRSRQTQEKKKARGAGARKPRPRKSMFRIRFRKAHDTYTAEELGATPRRLRRLTLSGVYVQNLKEHDIQSYFTIEAASEAGEPPRPALLQSEVSRGDKALQEICWNSQNLNTMDIEDDMLFSDQRLCFSVYHKRQLWSTRVVGHAFISLRDAFARPGVSMQSTHQLFKDKDEAERRSRDKQSASADVSVHSTSDTGSVVSATASSASSSAGLATMPRTWSGGNLFRRAQKGDDDEEGGSGKVRGHL